MLKSSYRSIEISKKHGNCPFNQIKLIVCTLKKNQLIRLENKDKKGSLPRRELNPGLLGESQLS